MAALSLAASLAALPPTERDTVLGDLTPAELVALEYDWRTWARPNQIAPPGDWPGWLVLAGRGFGKTRVGAEFVREEQEAGRAGRIALVAATAGDARDVIVEGQSGILATSPPWNRPLYEPSKRRLTWANGAMATLYSADEPERLRGPQHDLAWGDELAAWRYPEAYDQLMFGLRLGARPRAIFTTTPKPTELIKSLVADPSYVITRGSTYENAANLAPSFLAKIVRKYVGTRLGRQELNGEVLEDVEGALWTQALIEQHRLPVEALAALPIFRVVVAIDPSVTSTEDSDEAGVVVAAVGSGRCPCGKDGCGYVLSDKSGRMSPIQWARAAVNEYHARKADRIVAETNNGGDLVESQLRVVDGSVSFTKVTASKGKHTRAEPVEALYEQGRVHHVGIFPELEDQMTTWVPGVSAKSPDRMDALVWALSELMLSHDTGMIGYLEQQVAAMTARREAAQHG
ncbi:MAG: DNA-packaging protein [Gemmatimonadales bacterium]